MIGRPPRTTRPDPLCPYPTPVRSRAAVTVPGATGLTEAMTAGLTAGPRHATPDDWCVLPYSSGTTGAPKGCLHNIRGVMATAYGSIAWNPASSESVQLATLPLFHVTGMQHSMNGPLYNGRSEEHTSALQSLLRISYAVFCLNKNIHKI